MPDTVRDMPGLKNVTHLVKDLERLHDHVAKLLPALRAGEHVADTELQQVLWMAGEAEGGVRAVLERRRKRQ